MKSRVEMGVTLYKKDKIKFLILSGGAVKNEYQEAKIMASYAISLGVKKEDILIEGQSRSTYHNLMYSRDIMQINGLKNALVVTNSWHLRKADHYARKFKLDYAMVSASAPKSYCWIKVVVLHLGTNIKCITIYSKDIINYLFRYLLFSKTSGKPSFISLRRFELINTFLIHFGY
ncbi:MAG: YdcF family protein [Thomasclavelia ramosa]